ncbi:hypothetical protein [Dyella sp. 7MK23]|uniref:DNA-binding protein n=1 Tax=Dyella acidiphila TaxID=2775866 RepID=A0ABR9GE30_9GAMM|nr:hypothetical protein [Dyella acidiphila]
MTDWAREHGYPRQAVYAVLSGRSRCTRGRGHQIAIALGMKADASLGFGLKGRQQGRRPVNTNGPLLTEAGPLVVSSTLEKEVSP